MNSCVITYYRRGVMQHPQRRKGGRIDLVWRAAYSTNNAAGLPAYPFLTRTECYLDAQRRGGRPRFVEVTP